MRVVRSPSTRLYASAYSLKCIPATLWGQSTLVIEGSQHQSLYSDLYQCVILVVSLRTLEGDAGLMTTDEATPHTTTP
jgi:hypothetical protein